MQRISEKKLEAFTVGTFSKRQLVSFYRTHPVCDLFCRIHSSNTVQMCVNWFLQSKKELEEQKKKEDEAAAAHVSLVNERRKTIWNK